MYLESSVSDVPGPYPPSCSPPTFVGFVSGPIELAYITCFAPEPDYLVAVGELLESLSPDFVVGGTPASATLIVLPIEGGKHNEASAASIETVTDKSLPMNCAEDRK